MAKTTKTKKQKSRGFKAYILPAVVVLLAVAVVTNLMATASLFHDRDTLSREELTNVIFSAVDNMHQPFATDPRSGEQYLPAAKLVLPPPPQNVGAVVYTYTPGDPNNIEDINIASVKSIENAKTDLRDNVQNNDIFAYIPKLQACSRGVHVVFAQTGEGEAAGSKHLKNGQTVYFYTEQGCPNAALLSYVRQINSY